MEEVLEFYPYDFFHVDAQHMPFNEERIAAQCELATEFEVPVILRIKHPRHAYLVGALADLGLSGVEVPQVESEETAREAAESLYYPPIGKRSSGGKRVIGFKPNPNDSPRVQYTNWWNNSCLLVLQVESLEAITIARRLARPGVDCLSFGGGDLSLSLEYNRSHPFRTTEECLKYTIEQLKGTDTEMFVRIPKPSDRDKYIDMGAKVLREHPPGEEGRD
jgi:2-keto-3-deoxy-L-rhamnonate aldolase RhmA